MRVRQRLLMALIRLGEFAWTYWAVPNRVYWWALTRYYEGREEKP
jgi:hypothetical protein